MQTSRGAHGLTSLSVKTASGLDGKIYNLE
jgi:hypothetical protein